MSRHILRNKNILKRALRRSFYVEEISSGVKTLIPMVFDNKGKISYLTFIVTPLLK
jgi:hypothetical protein